MPADHPDLHAVAREILDSSFYMTLGTADADGRPWVSPVFYAADRYRAVVTRHWVLDPGASPDQRTPVTP
jgi:predicted pyridoxine 5'-phosphate oxidase superfamily flavin-nucleotide-binding protein